MWTTIGWVADRASRRGGTACCGSTPTASIISGRAVRRRETKSRACTRRGIVPGGSACGGARGRGSCCGTNGITSRRSTGLRCTCVAAQYEIEVELIQHESDFVHEPLHPQRTGFEIKYRGPDTHERLTTLPRSHLFRTRVDQPLSVAGLSPSATGFLHDRYGSSLRDIRRTYQRAFKAMLFVHRFALSARPRNGEGSELRYMLSEPARFAGWSTYRVGGAWKTHKADFDFNLLPVGDPYFPPAGDDRAHLSAKRSGGAVRLVGAGLRLQPDARGGARALRPPGLAAVRGGARQLPADPGILLRQIGRRSAALAARPDLLPEHVRAGLRRDERRPRGRPMDGAAPRAPISGCVVSGATSRSRT